MIPDHGSLWCYNCSKGWRVIKLVTGRIDDGVLEELGYEQVSEYGSGQTRGMTVYGHTERCFIVSWTDLLQQHYIAIEDLPSYIAFLSMMMPILFPKGR